MTDIEKQLFAEFEYGIISIEIFLKRFPVDIKNDPGFVISEVKGAIESGDPDELQMTIALIWLLADYSALIDLLNELLINPIHRSHQQIAMALQHIKSPSTVPFVRKVFETNFDYLEYTCSESDAIAKWFSHLLYSIGTEEAIELIKDYSNSKDEGIKREMRYRLSKIKV